MQKQLKRKYRIKKELEFEVEAIDGQEVQELINQFVNLSCGHGMEILDISFCSQETIKIEEI